MSTAQGDRPGWTRHWEVLDRVGLPDFTPDVLWQADVLHRAGVQLAPRPKAKQDGRVSSAGTAAAAAAASSSVAVGGGKGASNVDGSSRVSRRGPQSHPLPARVAVAAALAQSSASSSRGSSGGSGGGAVSLHVRLRPGTAKQPSKRCHQPPVPLQAAVNLQLVEDLGMYGPYQAQPQAWPSPSSSPPSPSPSPWLSGGGGDNGSPSAVYGNAIGKDDVSRLAEDGGSCQSASTLPSLGPPTTMNSPHGSGDVLLSSPGLAAAAAAVATQPDGSGRGDGTSGRGVSVVSFRLPTPTTQAARAAAGPPPPPPPPPPQLATAVAATPRERYRAIMERAGRAAVHKQQEGRRLGALAAAAGSPRIRRPGPGSPAQLRDGAAARRCGVAERAVWQLRRALDELSRFSCANAMQGGLEEGGSVLAQVDARIMALRRYDRVELGPDGRRTSVIPPPPPAFPLEAAHEYLTAAQSGVAGLEQLEEAVASMRKKLQIVVGQDTDDLRRAAAEALADTGSSGVSEPGHVASESGGADGGAGSQALPPYPVRRPSSGCTLGSAAPNGGGPNASYDNYYYQNYQNYQLPLANGMEPLSARPSYKGYTTPRRASTAASGSGFDTGASLSGAVGDAGLSAFQSPPSSSYPSYSGGVNGVAPPPQLAISPRTGHPLQPNRKLSSLSVASLQRPSGPGLDPAWALLESLVIQLLDSHASRIDMMDAFDKRPSTDSGDSTRGGGASAALLAAAAAGAHGAVHSRHRRGHRAGGFERLQRLVEVIDEDGSGAGMAEVKEAAMEAAVHGNAVRAAVAATLEPKHTEQALYFLAKLALMMLQGFLIAAGVDLLLGEVAWLLALLRCASGAGSPHLAALAAALRAYEMQRSYTTTLLAITERLEQAAEEAMDRAALAERQLAATHSALQRAQLEVADLDNNMREMERDMRQINARNQALEETVLELEGDLDRVEAAHSVREAAVQRSEWLSGMMKEEHLARIRARSKGSQVATEGDCSDPRAIPPVLQPTAGNYYPITPCVSSRHLSIQPSNQERKSPERSLTRSKSRRNVSASKAHGSRRAPPSRTTSRRAPRGSGVVAAEAAAATDLAAAAAALAAARAAAEVTDDEAQEDLDGDRGQEGYGIRRRHGNGNGDGDGDGGDAAARLRGSSTSSLASRRMSALRKRGGFRTSARARSKGSRSPDRKQQQQQQQGQQQGQQGIGEQQQGRQHEEVEQQQHEIQHSGQQGVEGVEYWTTQGDEAMVVEGGGGGAGEGEGMGSRQEPAELMHDAALEQAARDMFSDVFVRQTQ
ncbi:hypothetical protein VOLCADRAFT_92280 [Volvox carteri f. nagariensis]|uniref:Uncharacterized protein n=1 Tax=Volvox carteri f. nagariensis TaxID=3068 RepID=D8TZ87_VOLCA|nr:uncharacterized protein VOLCADRAFT_92280 [Volvox carteri f. nagariensis]EFJ47138.1 hypothetical protein VOLCADRAFT_92280 [Volvox carteri f. nagariensis]|eukprot:XP_002951687.1 hypothetical protein VOLCADRAFT_92280 [Volvox carteri f. nagariensis]